MPTGFYYLDWRKKRRADTERKRMHSRIVSAWKAGELTWNEYIRLEKKYRA